MHRTLRDKSADRTIRAGLESLRVPPVSADFDDRVRAALLEPMPCQSSFWPCARLALSTSVWSLAASLLLLHWFSGVGATRDRTAGHPAQLGGAAALRISPRLDALDRTMENGDASTLSLGVLGFGGRTAAPSSLDRDRRLPALQHSQFSPGGAAKIRDVEDIRRNRPTVLSDRSKAPLG